MVNTCKRLCDHCHQLIIYSHAWPDHVLYIVLACVCMQPHATQLTHCQINKKLHGVTDTNKQSLTSHMRSLIYIDTNVFLAASVPKFLTCIARLATLVYCTFTKKLCREWFTAHPQVGNSHSPTITMQHYKSKINHWILRQTYQLHQCWCLSW